jgi:hypothetical protein
MNTREATAKESNTWLQYKTRFEAKTKPMIEALKILDSAARFLETGVKQVSGQDVDIVTDAQAQRIAALYHRMQILDRQITGVLLKKYFVKFDDSGEIGIFADVADESDIFPAFSDQESMSGFGAVGILIGIGIAAVTLLGGGFITLKIMETQAETEAKKIAERMQKVDAAMMKLSPDKVKQYESLRESAVKQAKEFAKNVPGVSGMLSKFLGAKGASIAIAGGLAIAALYFLLPRLRRN